MREILVFTAVWLLIPLVVQAQDTASVFQTVRSIGSTPVKNQARTGMCWSFATGLPAVERTERLRPRDLQSERSAMGRAFWGVAA